MLYLVTTSSERFAFTTREYLNAFLNWAVLPTYTVEMVESTPALEIVEHNTWHMLKGLLF